MGVFEALDEEEARLKRELERVQKARAALQDGEDAPKPRQVITRMTPGRRRTKAKTTVKRKKRRHRAECEQCDRNFLSSGSKFCSPKCTNLYRNTQRPKDSPAFVEFETKVLAELKKREWVPISYLQAATDIPTNHTWYRIVRIQNKLETKKEGVFTLWKLPRESSSPPAPLSKRSGSDAIKNTIAEAASHLGSLPRPKGTVIGHNHVAGPRKEH